MVRTREVYERAIGLYNAGDVDGFADTHAEDAVLVTPAGTVRGREGIRAYWGRQRVAFPDLILTVQVMLEDDDAIASEWTWSGTNKGPVSLRDGTEVPPTGRKIEIKGMELARIRNGKIAEYHMYWDGLSLAQQLGPKSATP